MNAASQDGETHELITIIGSTMTEITDQFRAQGLSERRFSIVHKVERHRFIRVDGEQAEYMFGGKPLMAATFQRSPNN